MLKTVGVQSIRTGDQTINNGDLIIGTAGDGINFTANTNAPGMTSQLLNWYEEGTWTPTLVIGSGSVTYTTQTGTYTRIGRLITISGNIVINTVSSPGSFVVISSLPFAPTGADRGAGAVYANNMGAGCPQIELQIRGSAGDIYFQTFSLGATGNLGNYLQATSVLAFTATYEV
jgi:hypothetical protein